MTDKMLMNVGGPSAYTVMYSARVTLINSNLCLFVCLHLYFYAMVYKMNYTSTSTLIYKLLWLKLLPAHSPDWLIGLLDCGLYGNSEPCTSHWFHCVCVSE